MHTIDLTIKLEVDDNQLGLLICALNISNPLLKQTIEVHGDEHIAVITQLCMGIAAISKSNGLTPEEFIARYMPLIKGIRENMNINRKVDLSRYYSRADPKMN